MQCAGIRLVALLFALFVPALGLKTKPGFFIPGMNLNSAEECAYSTNWRQAQRCVCVDCGTLGQLYLNLDRECVPGKHSENFPGGQALYCTRNKKNYDTCCFLSNEKAIGGLVILVLNVLLVNFWIDKFRYLFNCLCPTLIEIYNTFKDDIKSALGMDGDGEEEEEEE